MVRGVPAFLLVACSHVQPSDVMIDRIVPASATNDMATAVRVEGSGFHLPLTSDLDTGGLLATGATVHLGGFVLDGVIWRGEQLIEGTVPAGLDAGVYEVTVTLGDDIAVLSPGFEVIEPVPVDLGPFGTPMPLTALNTAGGEDDPSLTADLLELYFERDTNIWKTTRASAADDWTAPVMVNELSTGGETTPAISPDGLTIYFASARAGGLGGADIWRSTRPDRASAWTAPVHVPELSSAGGDSAPMISPDGLVMYLTRDYDIYRSQRASTSASWDAPVPVTELATVAGEYAAWVDASETTVFVTSDYMNVASSDDLWTATRADRAVPFGPLVRMTELASPQDEEDPWLSPDMRLIVFSSDRTGNNDLYFATR